MGYLIALLISLGVFTSSYSYEQPVKPEKPNKGFAVEKVISSDMDGV